MIHVYISIGESTGMLNTIESRCSSLYSSHWKILDVHEHLCAIFSVIFPVELYRCTYNLAQRNFLLTVSIQYRYWESKYEIIS